MRLGRAAVWPLGLITTAIQAGLVGLAAICALMLYEARLSAYVEATHEASSLARLLQADLEKSVEVADLSLRNVDADLRLVEQHNLAPELRRPVLENDAMPANAFGVLTLIDDTGHIAFDSSGRGSASTDYSGRDYFRRHRDQPEVGLQFTALKTSLVTGQPRLLLSRRLNHVDGSFAGVITETIGPSVLARLFDRPDLRPDDDVLLNSDVGLVFQRNTGARFFGASVGQSALGDALRAKRDGIVEAALPSDGIARLWAAQRLHSVDLTIVVGLSRQGIYEAWWRQVVVIGSAVLVLLLLAGLLSAGLRRQVFHRSRVETALRESETRFSLLMESATDLITCLDMSLRRTYVSPASLEVLGYEPHELLGVIPHHVTHPDDAAHLAERFRLLREGKVERDILTNRMRHKAGHYVWVEAKVSLLRDPVSSKPVAILCAVRDISARKAAADELLAANRDLERLSRHLARARDTAERASAAKSSFLAGVSHELRTPLNGIMGYAELLQIEGGLNDSQTARVSAMRAAGQHLLSMINNVLDLSEIETGHIDMHLVSIDVGDIAGDCMDLIRPLAQRKGLTLRCEALRGDAVGMLGDPTRLRQILVNLLGNAVKFTRSGSVTLRYFQLGQDRARIEIADTGPGIATGERWRLFQEFDRIAETARAEEGAGLGLALSHRLAVAMSGEIGHSDNPGGGSVFWLELPSSVDRSDPAPGLADDNAAAPPQPVQGSCRILVVDDVAINRDIATAFLAAAGHETVCADGGEQAVELAAKEDFDLILMDVRMPDLDGRQATRRIRAFDSHRAQVPIIALTAQAFANEVVECREAGMNAHLAKPFSQTALLAVVARARASVMDPQAEKVETAVVAQFGADLAVLNEEIFAQTTSYLPIEAVASHLRSLTLRTEALLTELERLLSTEAVAEPDWASLVAAGHALGGSAGMFGFERLAAVARHFEFVAAKTPDANAQAATSLRAAALVSLTEMHQRVALAKRDQPESQLRPAGVV